MEVWRKGRRSGEKDAESDQEATEALQEAGQARAEARAAAAGPLGAVGAAEVGEFLDVMDQAVEQPLDADLGPAAIGEAVEPLVAAQVGESLS